MKDIYELTNYKSLPLDDLYTDLWYEGQNNLPNESSSFDDVKLNKLIKEKVGYLKDLKKIYDYNDELINQIALINISLIELGLNIDDLFYETVTTTPIIIGKKTTSQTNKKLGRGSIPTTYSGLFTVDRPDNLFKENLTIKESMIILGKKDMYGKRHKVEVYNSLIHELRHALTSKRKTNVYLDQNTFYKRIGLAEYFYTRDYYDPFVSADLIDEVFNEYFTELILNNILKYKNNNIDNISIKKLLKSLRVSYKSGLYSSNAYDFERFLCYPLLKNKDIVDIANDAALTGNLSPFANLFTSFVEYSNTLEELSNLYYDESENKEFEDKINNFKELTLRISKF